MKEINPNKIKKAEIVVGIPSYKEADTISNVVKQADYGLRKYFSHKSTVIINSDNNSPDNTGEVFLQTKTKTPKIYISTPPGLLGKGNNLRNLFLKTKNLRARASITVDADLKSITPEWIKCLITPILKGYDYIVPIYHRDKHDASITNHLCYPLVYGLLGYNIRQPIGGDMGFSKKLVEYWLAQNWSEAIRNYGIDIFMTLNAIKSGVKLGQADLGSKIHKLSAPKLDDMFLEVAGTLFQFLSRNKNLWQRKINLKKPPLVSKSPRMPAILGDKVKSKTRHPKVAFDYKEIEKKALSEFPANYKFIKPYISEELCLSLEQMFFKEKSLKIDDKLWPKIVYQLFFIYQKKDFNKERIIKLLRALYFARTMFFIKESFDKTQEESEKIIQNEAHYFFKTRNYLFSLEKK